MSQNYNRGLENEYLVPYITFTKDPTGSAISSATLTVSPALPDGTTTIDLTQTFTAFASNKEYTLTPDTTFEVTLTLDGAAGGTGGGGAPALGGKGGKVTGTVLLESGTAYKLIIGGQGGLGGRTSGLVGFGGTGGKGDPTGDPDDIEKYAGDGGGLTGIFKTSVTQANALLIAGGGGGVPSTAVYLVSPLLIALIAAFLILSGVSKSGSPAPSPITSFPAALSSLAF